MCTAEETIGHGEDDINKKEGAYLRVHHVSVGHGLSAGVEQKGATVIQIPHGLKFYNNSPVPIMPYFRSSIPRSSMLDSGVSPQTNSFKNGIRKYSLMMELLELLFDTEIRNVAH